jgi:hypothetical protein
MNEKAVSEFQRSLDFLIKLGVRGGPAGSSSERAVRTLLSSMTDGLRLDRTYRWLDLDGDAAKAVGTVISTWLRVPETRAFICDEIRRGLADEIHIHRRMIEEGPGR